MKRLILLLFVLFSANLIFAQQDGKLIDKNPFYQHPGNQRPQDIQAPKDSMYMLVSYYNLSPDGKRQNGTIGQPVWIHKDSLIAKGFFDGAIRLHGIHIVNTNSGSDSTAFFDSGKLDLAKASPINNTNERNRFDFSLLVSGETFKPSIRENKNFRFLLSGYTGLIFTVPAGETIAITFTVASVADGYNMSRMPG